MRRPLPPDVPVHRGRVGAMRVASGYSQYPEPYTFKPYVYQGTGVDTLTSHMDEPPPSKPRRKRKRKAAAPKPPPVYSPAAPRREPRPEPVPEVEFKPPRFQKPKPEPKAHWVEKRPARPSPGWRPTTGDAIEALLRELED